MNRIRSHDEAELDDVAVLRGLSAVVVRDVLGAATADPWGLRQRDVGDPEGEDVRIASVGELSVVYFANRALRACRVVSRAVTPGHARPGAAGASR